MDAYNKFDKETKLTFGRCKVVRGVNGGNGWGTILGDVSKLDPRIAARKDFWRKLNITNLLKRTPVVGQQSKVLFQA